MREFEQLVKSRYAIWGNDISWHQAVINALRFLEVQKPRFVVVRLTLGPWADGNAITNVQMLAGKVDLHVYAAFLPGYKPREQLAIIKRYWDWLKADFRGAVNGRLWLDIEKQGLDEMIGVALSGTTDLGSIDDIVGHKVGIYTNGNYWNYYQMAKDTRFKDRLVWLASYTEENNQPYPNIPTGCEPVIWQYGQVDGKESGMSSYALDGDVILDISRYLETLTGPPVKNGEDPDPDPEPGPETITIRTRYKYINLRTSPTTATSANIVGITNRLGGEMKAVTKIGEWYKVILHIHESTVQEV